MELQLIQEAQKIWNSAYNKKQWKNFVIDLEIHKRLLTVLQPGDYYYWILNSKNGVMEFISPEVEKVLVYPFEMYDLSFFSAFFILMTVLIF